MHIIPQPNGRSILMLSYIITSCHYKYMCLLTVPSTNNSGNMYRIINNGSTINECPVCIINNRPFTYLNYHSFIDLTRILYLMLYQITPIASHTVQYSTNNDTNQCIQRNTLECGTSSRCIVLLCISCTLDTVGDIDIYPLQSTVVIIIYIIIVLYYCINPSLSSCSTNYILRCCLFIAY